MLEIDAIKNINDFKQQLNLILIEYIQWQEPRLSFGKFSRAQVPSLTDIMIEKGIDITAIGEYIWTPKFLYGSQVDQKIVENQVFLYQDGRVVLFRKLDLTYKCTFDFSRYPNDFQVCPIIPYVQNWPERIVKLKK